MILGSSKPILSIIIGYNGGKECLIGFCFAAAITLYPWWIPLKLSSFHTLYSELSVSISSTTYNHCFSHLKEGQRGCGDG